VALAMMLASACSTRPQLREYSFDGEAMGTTYTVKIAVRRTLPEIEVEELRTVIQSELDAVNARMSTYLPNSELSLLNRYDGERPFPVSSELLEVLVTARQVGVATQGAYDITVGPLVDAWGFGPQGKPATVPEKALLDELAAYTGWDKIEIDDVASTVRKSSAEVHCDLSGIAKGHGVDRLSEALSARGFHNYMVEVGGEVRVSGSNRQGREWRIAIERPSVSGGLQKILPFRDMSMATSGDYRNFYEEDGVRYSHIIDPRTAQPIQHRLASVSVVEDLCMVADAYATALLVLGEQEGYEMAIENDLAALFLVREASGDFREVSTPRFESLFGGSGQTGVKE
jgi:thiamine biosynthesis lipoprotein